MTHKKIYKMYRVSCYQLPMLGEVTVAATTKTAAKLQVAKACGWFEPEHFDNKKETAAIIRCFDAEEVATEQKSARES